MKNIYHPPAFGETVISLLLTEENSEEILGDLAEMFNAHGHQGNLRKAQIWYYLQVARSAPSLLQIKLSNIIQRSFDTMSTNLNSHNKSSLWISLIAIIPALVLVIPGILQSGFGYWGANNARDALFASVPALEASDKPNHSSGRFASGIYHERPASHEFPF